MTPLATFDEGDFLLEILDGTQAESIRLLLPLQGETVESIDFSGSDWSILTSGFSYQLTRGELAGALVGVNDPASSDSTLWCESAVSGGSPGAPNATCP